MRDAAEVVFEGINALIDMCSCDAKDICSDSEDGCDPDAKAEPDFLDQVISGKFSSGADGSDSKAFERQFFSRESGTAWLQRKGLQRPGSAESVDSQVVLQRNGLR